jgi:hypothetical protein
VRTFLLLLVLLSPAAGLGQTELGDPVGRIRLNVLPIIGGSAALELHGVLHVEAGGGGFGLGSGGSTYGFALAGYPIPVVAPDGRTLELTLPIRAGVMSHSAEDDAEYGGYSLDEWRVLVTGGLQFGFWRKDADSGDNSVALDLLLDLGWARQISGEFEAELDEDGEPSRSPPSEDELFVRLGVGVAF